MPVITFNEKTCTVTCTPKDKLTDLAMSLEFMSNNYLGRGVNCWDVNISKVDSGCIVYSSTKQASGRLQISQVTKLGDAVKQGVLPRNLQGSFHLGQGYSPVQDGQNKLYSKKSDEFFETIIESKDVNPQIQLSVMSYGFADMMTGLFALGVKEFKYQIAQAASQLYMKHNLSDWQIVAYFRQTGNDYNVEGTVDSLPDSP